MVQVLAAQRRVAVGGLDLEDAARDLEDGDVEGAATEIIDRNGLAILCFHAKRKGSSRRFIDDAGDLQPCNLASILGCLALRIVEVRWDRDDSLVHAATKVRRCSLLHLLQHQGANLAGRELFPVSLDPSVAIWCLDDLVGEILHVFLSCVLVETTANEALGGKDSVLRVCHSLTLGRDAHKPLAITCHRYDGRSGPHAFTILEHLRGAALHDRNA
mmetsp:Transcript_42622/g.123228  ORF Transcript_42622/g.123228 Transcript_42622/m.123228 type:complete len:216 (-) Transcript_42622:222-869(-)